MATQDRGATLVQTLVLAGAMGLLNVQRRCSISGLTAFRAHVVEMQPVSKDARLGRRVITTNDQVGAPPAAPVPDFVFAS